MQELKTRVNLLTDDEYEVICLYRKARTTSVMQEKLQRVAEFHKSLAEHRDEDDAE